MTPPIRRHFRRSAGVAAGLAVAVVGVLLAPNPTSASTAPGLGTAAGYAVLAATPSITNSGLTVISGSVGIAPAAAVKGFPPGIVSNGTIEAATTVAAAAKSDLTTAYGVASSSPCNFDRTNKNLGGLTLTPGTYCQTTAPTLTGTVTLSGDGVFIFQIGSTLVTAPGAAVVLTNGAQACNVYWQVGSSATIDTTTTFVGTILALTDISVNNGADITGRALAQNGAVTLINDRIRVPGACTAATVAGPTSTPTPTPTPTPRAGSTTPTPHVGSMGTGGDVPATALIVAGSAMLLAARWPRRSARRKRRGLSGG